MDNSYVQQALEDHVQIQELEKKISERVISRGNNIAAGRNQGILLKDIAVAFDLTYPRVYFMMSQGDKTE